MHINRRTAARINAPQINMQHFCAENVPLQLLNNSLINRSIQFHIHDR